MANIVDVMKKLIRPHYYVLLTLSVLILFIIVGYYGYNAIRKQQVNRFKDVANVNRRSKESVILFFHVDWCPHCKKALPEWNTFKSQNDGVEINGYKLKCVEVDCTKETSEVTRVINQYKIESYPTVKLIRDEKTIDFESKITNSSLNAFVTTMLNN
jgi:thioredoxin-like negative regulator of GroEL